MDDKVMIDARLKRFIDSLYGFDNLVCFVRFTDLEDGFWFNNEYELKEFLNIQTRERFYNKELRAGYFEYMNENREIIRYNIKSVNRGKLILE